MRFIHALIVVYFVLRVKARGYLLSAISASKSTMKSEIGMNRIKYVFFVMVEAVFDTFKDVAYERVKWQI